VTCDGKDNDRSKADEKTKKNEKGKQHLNYSNRSKKANESRETEKKMHSPAMSRSVGLGTNTALNWDRKYIKYMLRLGNMHSGTRLYD
jgi:hypothetical protein